MKRCFLLVLKLSLTKRSYLIFCGAIIFSIYYLILNSNILISINLNFKEIKPNNVEINNYDQIMIEKNFHSTLVSAYFDIDRNGRPREEYFEWIKQTIRLNAPFIFFVQLKYLNLTMKLFENKTTPYLVKTIELNELPCYKDLDKVSRIIGSTSYRIKIEKNDRIETKYPLYSIVIFSKFYLLKRAALFNPFKTKKFIWVDAGISRFYAGFDLSLPIRGLKIPDDKFFTIFETRAFFDSYFHNRDEKNFMWSAKSYILAGVMGGTLPVISRVNDLIEKKWHKMISNGLVNNEQIALILCYFDQPKLFRLFSRSTLIVLFNSRDMKEIFSYLAL